MGHGGVAEPVEGLGTPVQQVELGGEGLDVARLVDEPVDVVVEQRAGGPRHERDASGDLGLVGHEGAALLEARQQQHVGARQLLDRGRRHPAQLDARVRQAIGDHGPVLVVDGAEDQEASLAAGGGRDPRVEGVVEALARFDAAEEDRGQARSTALAADHRRGGGAPVAVPAETRLVVAALEERRRDGVGGHEERGRGRPLPLLRGEPSRVGGVGGAGARREAEPRGLAGDDLVGVRGVGVRHLPERRDATTARRLDGAGRGERPHVHHLHGAERVPEHRPGGDAIVPGERPVPSHHAVGDAPARDRERRRDRGEARHGTRDARGDQVHVVARAHELVDLVPGGPPDAGRAECVGEAVQDRDPSAAAPRRPRRSHVDPRDAEMCPSNLRGRPSGYTTHVDGLTRRVNRPATETGAGVNNPPPR